MVIKRALLGTAEASSFDSRVRYSTFAARRNQELFLIT